MSLSQKTATLSAYAVCHSGEWHKICCFVCPLIFGAVYTIIFLFVLYISTHMYIWIVYVCTVLNKCHMKTLICNNIKVKGGKKTYAFIDYIFVLVCIGNIFSLDGGGIQLCTGKSGRISNRAKNTEDKWRVDSEYIEGQHCFPSILNTVRNNYNYFFTFS